MTNAFEDLKIRVWQIETEDPADPADDARPDPTPRLDALNREIEALKERLQTHGDQLEDGPRLDRLAGRQDELFAAIVELKTRIEAAGAAARPTVAVNEFNMVQAQAYEAMREVELLKIRLNRAENQATRSTQESTALRDLNSQLIARHEQTMRAIEDLKGQIQAAQEDFAAFKEQAQDDRDQARRREPVSTASFANMASMASMEGPAAFAFPGRPRSAGR